MSDETHEEFQDRLQKSLPSVLAVSRWLRSLGAVLEVPETHIAPTRSECHLYSDSGDIHIVKPWKGVIEVKTAKKWPGPPVTFPFPVMFVDRKGSFDAKNPKPLFYAICNAPRTWVAWVRVDLEIWEVHKTCDPVRPKYPYEAYTIAPDNVEYYELI